MKNKAILKVREELIKNGHTEADLKETIDVFDFKSFKEFKLMKKVYLKSFYYRIITICVINLIVYFISYFIFKDKLELFLLLLLGLNWHSLEFSCRVLNGLYKTHKKFNIGRKLLPEVILTLIEFYLPVVCILTFFKIFFK